MNKPMPSTSARHMSHRISFIRRAPQQWGYLFWPKGSPNYGNLRARHSKSWFRRATGTLSVPKCNV
jgi:hypothetical protein